MTVSLIQLWLPIVLGGTFAWIASALIHMLLKYHNSDFKGLSNEDDVMEAVRAGSPKTGLYNFPHCAMSEMQDKAVQEKFNRGPVGFVTVFPNGLPNMPKLMGQQIGFFVVSCLLVAYCATLALAPGAEYMTVFRFVGTVGFLTFGWGIIPYSIWYGHPWSTTGKYLLDAFIYGLVAAGTFAWLWPAAA